jgi:D-glycero-alpha-D-manno-heptose 1-phosphate guanylyltransferase
MSLSDITAAILVGGLGTRLRSVLPDLPKPLAEVNGRPFLSYLLDQLDAANIREVVFCTGYRAEQIETTFGNHYKRASLRYSQEPMSLGTGGALRLALPLLNSDPVLVMNGDSMCRCDLQAFLNWHLSKQAEAALLLAQVNDVSRFGRVNVNDEGVVTEFIEKDPSNTAPGWINAGIYLLSQKLISQIPPEQPVSLEREVFPNWIGHGLYAYQGTTHFIDIGTPESYQLASHFLSES